MHQEETYHRENIGAHKKEALREAGGEQSVENIPERMRMNEVRELQQKCSSLDRDLLKIIERFSVERAIKKGKALETLAFGKVLSERQLGKTGVNAITRNEYQGDPPRTAFVKPQSGEVNLVYDTKTKEGYRINKKKNEDGMFEEIRSVLPEKYAGGIKHFQETLAPQLKTDIARYYGIAPQDVTVFDKGFSGRLGIEMGGSVHREYAVSRIDQLLDWETVPLTVLRSESNHSDISSVQEAVKGSGEGEPPRSLDVDLLQEIQENGPDHVAAKSFMRLACIDYLVKSSDRHPENILYNPSEQKFYGIDNGRSMGLNAKPTGGKSKILDRYLSIPLSVTQEFPDWKLDAEAHKSVKELYQKVLDYLEYKDTLQQKKVYDKKSDGLEAKYISGLFEMVYDNQKIASREAMEFILRLKHLAENGQPPKLEVGKDIADMAQFYPTVMKSQKINN